MGLHDLLHRRVSDSFMFCLLLFIANHFCYLKNSKAMLTDINPKLPMRDKAVTREFYINKLGFQQFGSKDYDGYLMVQKDNIQIHFFEFKELNPADNYGQVYIRTDDIDKLYRSALDKQLAMPEAGHLQTKPWQQKEFSLLDPDNNLLTFGQSL